MKFAFEQFAKIADGCLHKEVEQLTEDERTALAVVSGCEMRYEIIRETDEAFVCRATTVNPVGIIKVDGKFRIAEGPRERGDTLKVKA